MKYFYVTVAILLSVATAITNCQWSASSRDEKFELHATFDLSPLAGVDYAVIDSQATEISRNYTYVFNICGVVNTVPTAGTETTPCYSTGVEEPVHYPAYQVSRSGSICMRLGVDATAENTRWALLDEHDPTVGVYYSYINGDDLGCGEGRARSFILELSCVDNEYNIPDEEPVYENNCIYKVSIESIYGCPVECGLNRGSLCGHKGVCKFDLDTRKPHCYCQKGWTGHSCSDEGENRAEGFTNTTALLGLVLLMLALVEFAIIIMWNRVKRLRLDPSAYTNFAASDEFAE